MTERHLDELAQEDQARYWERGQASRNGARRSKSLDKRNKRRRKEYGS